MDKRIFISYRRADSQVMTDRIYAALVDVFDKDAVFRDIHSIPAGEDFCTHIRKAIEECDALLVVIGDQWINIKGKDGKRRLDNPDDWVMLEVEAGLTRGEIPVIPLFVGGVTHLEAGKLPDSLAQLASQNALPIRPDPDFKRDIGRLVKNLIENHGFEQKLPKLLSACQNQVKNMVASVSHKYKPELYVNRAIEDDINGFFNIPQVDYDRNCFLIIAPAGSGKTNLLCYLAQQRAILQPTLLLMGGSLYLSGTTGLLGGIRTELEDASSEVVFKTDADSLHSLDQLAIQLDQDALLLIDAINEYDRPAEMRKALQEILRKTCGKRVKLLVTCRDYYWGLFRGDFWEDAKINVLTTDDDESDNTEFALDQFSPDEQVQALVLYLKHYGIIGQPVGNAAEQCRHPLLMRFFCEAYRGQDIGQVGDIRLNELFDRYWEQKLVSIANRMISQGDERLQNGLAQEVGEYLLNIASHMLHENIRSIPLDAIPKATKLNEKFDDPRSIYGRVRDEFIILEEKEIGKGRRKQQIAFVYEEFMEYVMARSLIADWNRDSSDESSILVSVEKLTEKYDEFAQILGVMVYLALMLKDERNLEFWPLLLAKGEQWQKVVFEAFRKLPEQQLDSSVLNSLDKMLHSNDKSIQQQVLDLIKVEKLGRAVSTSPEIVSKIFEFTKHEQESVSRRAVLALTHIRDDGCIPILVDAFNHPQKSVSENAITALKNKGQASVDYLVEAFQNSSGNELMYIAKTLSRFGWVPFDEKNLVNYYLLVSSEFRNTFLYVCKQLGSAAVPYLIKALEHENPNIRASVGEALGYLGDKRVVPTLITMLRDNSREVRICTVDALGMLGDPHAVSALAETIKNDSPSVRKRAAEALKQIGDIKAIPVLINALKDIKMCVVVENILLNWNDERIAPYIIEALEDNDFRVRNRAERIWVFWSVRMFPQSEHYLIKLLSENSLDVREDAIHSIINSSEYHNMKQAIPSLIELLKDRDAPIKMAAASALGQLGGEKAVLPLIEVLKDDEGGVRSSAASALGQLGDEKAVLPLIEVLKDDEGGVRSSAASALGQLGDEKAVLPLIEALKNDDGGVRSVAASALGQLGDEKAVLPLIEALKNDDGGVRSVAASALGQLGDGRAVCHLIEMIRDSDRDVQESAFKALAQISDEKAVLPMIEMLKDDDWSVRRLAASALGQLGDERAVLPLIEAFKDDDGSVRGLAISALGQLGSEKTVLPLIDALKDDDWSVRSCAASALGQLGDERAVLPLIDALKDDDGSVQLNTIWALGQLEQLGTKRAEQLLIKLIKDCNRTMRLKVVDILVEFVDSQTIYLLFEALKGRKHGATIAKVVTRLVEFGSTAVNPLINALKDDDKYLRESAALALGKLGSRQAVIPLTEALKDNVPDVKKNAAEALGLLGDVKAFPYLVNALEDNSSFVHKMVAESVLVIGPKAALFRIKQDKKGEKKPI